MRFQCPQALLYKFDCILRTSPLHDYIAYTPIHRITILSWCILYSIYENNIISHFALRAACSLLAVLWRQHIIRRANGSPKHAPLTNVSARSRMRADADAGKIAIELPPLRHWNRQLRVMRWCGFLDWRAVWTYSLMTLWKMKHISRVEWLLEVYFSSVFLYNF